MPKRLFVAINLPMDLKREIFEIQKNIDKELGEEYSQAKVFKWVAMENLHITLKFIGEVGPSASLREPGLAGETLRAGESQIPKIIDDTEKMTQDQKTFEIKTERICYDNEKAPRLIWLTTSKGHITLARIKEWAFRRIEIDERPSINQDFERNFSVNSIELMESVLHRTGPEYKILQSFPLASKLKILV
ncbi:MAG: 2'-5' RNA ligase family protein [bacterium]